MFRIATIIGFGLIAAACAQPAYVHHSGEFNRNSPAFGQDPTDISTVTICYSSRGSTPAMVLGLARQECGKFGKTAKFTGQDYAHCPLPTPVSAHFSCLGGEVDGAAGNRGGSAGGSGGHQVNYDGILFSY